MKHLYRHEKNIQMIFDLDFQGKKLPTRKMVNFEPAMLDTIYKSSGITSSRSHVIICTRNFVHNFLYVKFWPCLQMSGDS